MTRILVSISRSLFDARAHKAFHFLNHRFAGAIRPCTDRPGGQTQGLCPYIFISIPTSAVSTIRR